MFEKVTQSLISSHKACGPHCLCSVMSGKRKCKFCLPTNSYLLQKFFALADSIVSVGKLPNPVASHLYNAFLTVYGLTRHTDCFVIFGNAFDDIFHWKRGPQV